MSQRLTNGYNTFDNDINVDNKRNDAAHLMTGSRYQAASDPDHIMDPDSVKGSFQHAVELSSAIATLSPYIHKRQAQDARQLEVVQIMPDGAFELWKSPSITEFEKSIAEEISKIDVAPPPSVVDSETFHAQTLCFTKSDARHLIQCFNSDVRPTLLIRRHCVLVISNPIRAVIMADKMLLIAPPEMKDFLVVLTKHFTDFIRENHNDESLVPVTAGEDPHPESIFYSAVFTTLAALHEQQYDFIIADAHQMFQDSQKEKHTTSNLEPLHRIHSISSLIVTEQRKLTAFSELLRSLLADEDCAALLNLSVLKKTPTLYQKPLKPEILQHHELPSSLLESQLRDCENNAIRLDNLSRQIAQKQATVQFRMDSLRNQLLIADTLLAIVMASIAVATFFTSGFGMNFDSGLTDVHQSVFYVVFVFVGFSAFLTMYIITRYYRKKGVLPPAQSYKEWLLVCDDSRV